MVSKIFSIVVVVALLIASAGVVSAKSPKPDVPVAQSLVYRELPNGEVVLFDITKGAIPMDEKFLSKLDWTGDLWYEAADLKGALLPEGSMIHLNTANGDTYRCRVNYQKNYVWDEVAKKWILEWQGCLVTLKSLVQNYTWNESKQIFEPIPGSFSPNYHTLNASPRVGRIPIKLVAGDKVSYFDANGKEIYLNCGSWFVPERPDCTIAK